MSKMKANNSLPDRQERRSGEWVSLRAILLVATIAIVLIIADWLFMTNAQAPLTNYLANRFGNCSDPANTSSFCEDFRNIMAWGFVGSAIGIVLWCGAILYGIKHEQNL